MSMPHSLPVPQQVASTESLRVHVDEHPCELLATGAGPAVLLRADDAFGLRLMRPEGWEGLRVAPARAGAQCDLAGEILLLECPSPQSLLLEVSGRCVAYVLVVPPPGSPPEPGRGGRLIRIPAGEVREIGVLALHSGDVLWIEEGAVARGQVVVVRAEDVVIGGGGVLDGSLPVPGGERMRPVVIEESRRVSLKNLTIINARHWMVTVGRSEEVLIESTRQFSTGNGTDGMDIVGSRLVTVRGCFLRNGDDNVAIKALHAKRGSGVGQSCPGAYTGDWEADVQDILVEGCAFYNDCGGSSMEIGYETRAGRIGDVTFRDIDVMAVHDFGSVFGIHNGDRATVENILWENIRVDHCYDKIVDLRVLNSRWNTDASRGRIRNVTLRNIQVAESPYNPGYTVSLIGGFDAAHDVQGVRFEKFFLGGRKVLSADDLSLFTRHAGGITFE